MKSISSTIGITLGLLMIAKGAISILGTELVFALIAEATGLLGLNSGAVTTAEKGLEELFISHGIVSISTGAMYATAGIFDDALFFSTAFLVYNFTSLALHALFIRAGNLSLVSTFIHLLEMGIVLTVMGFFLMKEKFASRLISNKNQPRLKGD